MGCVSGHQETPSRISNALRHSARRASASGAGRLSLQRADFLRLVLVPLVHAPTCPSARQCTFPCSQFLFPLIECIATKGTFPGPPTYLSASAGGVSMRDFWSDVRHGARMLGKSPAFTAVAILTLAVGIGANAAVFSVVNSFLLHPLPVRDPGRLVVVANGTHDYEDPHEVSNPDFKDFQAQSDAFSDMTAYLINFAGLSADNRSERVLATYVKGNYFTALGLQPAVGRLFLPSEGETRGADPIIVLGYSYWMQRFNGDPSIVGKSVNLNGQPVTVVGVAPKGFFGTFFIVEANVYVPLAMIATSPDSAKILNNRSERQLR